MALVIIAFCSQLFWPVSPRLERQVPGKAHLEQELSILGHDLNRLTPSLPKIDAVDISLRENCQNRAGRLR
jgi:hypothetical protein